MSQAGSSQGSRQSMASRWKISRRLLFLPPIAVGLITVVSLAMSKKELVRVPVQETAAPVRVMLAKESPIAPVAIGYGTARPSRIWSAVAEVGGRVQQTHPHLRSGIEVDRGETLLVIDEVDYRLREQQRSAELSQASAQLEQLLLSEQSDQTSLVIQKELLEVRKSDANRLMKLSGTSAASISEADAAHAVFLQQKQAVQTLENTIRLYPAQIKAAQATVQLAQARLSEATRDVERTKIVAPFAGVLSRVTLEPDQYVAPSERMFELHDLQSVEIESQFSLEQLSRLMPHRPSAGAEPTTKPADLFAIASSDVTAIVIARSGGLTLRYHGKPVRITELVDETTRTVGVVVRVTNGQQPSRPAVQPERTDDQEASLPAHEAPAIPLRPGTFCEVMLRSKTPVSGVMVPRSSIEGGEVYVMDPQSRRLHRRPIEVGFTIGDQAAVTAGLAEGELVAMKLLATPMDGRLIEPETVAAAEDNEQLSLREASETR